MKTREATGAQGMTRREMLVLGVGAFAVATLPGAVRRGSHLFRRQAPVMGTIAELAVVHADPMSAHAGIDAALAALERVERLMTRFEPASDVGRANGAAGQEPVTVSAATAAVLTEALAWADASGGAFDPTLGRAIRLWDVGHRRTPPPEGAVHRLAGRRLYRSLALDRWRGAPVIRLTEPDAEIDLGGIAKGYGVDRAAEALRAHGITRAIVNVGGDLYAIGEAERGGPWRVGIRSPHEPARLAGVLEISDGAVATSGDYLQYFQHGGRRYHHLLDPSTGAPRLSAVRSITVTAQSCVAADAAATAVFGMEPQAAERLLRACAPGARIASRIADGASTGAG